MTETTALQAKPGPTVAARRSLSSEDLLRIRNVEDFYFRYADCINDDDLESWPDFFSEQCLYKIIPRLNHERGLPIAILLSESRGGIIDRLVAIRNTMVYAPRYVLCQVSNIRIIDDQDGVLTTRSLVSVYQTLEGETVHLMIGRSFDKLDARTSNWTFLERVVVYDTELLPATVIYPI